MRHTGAMRIALVHYTYAPVIAGVEVVMAEHARLFGEAGHHVTVICGNDAEECESSPHQPARCVLPVLGANARVVPFDPNNSRGQIEFEFGEAVEALKVRLREVFEMQDVVILHNVATMHFHLALTAALWALGEEMQKTRFIVWIHDLAACNPDYGPFPIGQHPWSLLARAQPHFDYVAVSDLRRQQFVDLTGRDDCRVISNGVEPTSLLDLPPAIAQLVQRHALLERDVLLLHPARLLRRKNVELTLRVIAALKSAGCSCAGLITAPPDAQNAQAAGYQQELRYLQGQLRLDNDALFLSAYGPLSAREMRGLFAVADALFFPSRQEGFGIPLLEAALHRLPIFCSYIEPLKTVLPHHCITFGLDSPPEKIAELVLKTLTSEPLYRARKECVNRLSWRAIYRNFLAPMLGETDTLPRL